jgi:hypothetical protein
MALYCADCGKALPNDAAFCYKCGKAVPDAVAISAGISPETQATFLYEMGIFLPVHECVLHQSELSNSSQYPKPSEGYLVFTNRRLIIKWAASTRLEQIPLDIIRSICMQGGWRPNVVWVDLGRKSYFWSDGVIRLHFKDYEQASEAACLIAHAMLMAEA